MKALRTALALALLAVAGLAGSAGAQYMFLDSNGNGQHDPGDVLNASDTTSVDVYLRLNEDIEGNSIFCPTDGASDTDCYSWSYILRASGGTVQYANFVNTSADLGFTTSGIGGVPNPGSDNTEFYTAWANASGGSVTGLLRMAHMTIEILSGSPSIAFDYQSSLAPSDAFTTFASYTCLSPCIFDVTWNLYSTDFGCSDFSGYGLGPPAGTDQAPQVTAPASQTVNENALLSFTVTATDPDGDVITSLSAAPMPAGVSFTPNGTNTSGSFTWTPDYTQAGGYDITFTASNALSGSATTHITVNNVDRPPTVSAPSTASGDENTLITFGVTATDPDGDATLLSASGLPAGATFPSSTTGSSTFSWTPGFSDAAGSPYPVTFTAANSLSGTAATQITVNNVNRAPSVSAPPSASGSEGMTITFGVSATDPDGDHVVLTAAGTAITAGGTFTDAGGTASGGSGTFTWATSAGDAGSYSVTFTGNDGNGGTGTATTSVSVSQGNAAPTVTATPTASGDEGTTITFPVTATDPDGNHVSLTAAGTAITAGATFTDGGGTASGGSGTFSWATTFSDAGSYSVTFTGDDGNGGTDAATTDVTVNNVDRAPVVTAPGTANGSEGGTVTFGVTASDPDGEAIASLTADTSALPSGNDASFTANGTNTSGTFTWHPVSGDAGTYNVTFTATNAMTGTASTTITVGQTNAEPSITASGNTTANEGDLVSLSATATDADAGQTLTISVTGYPASLTLSHTPSVSPATASLDGTLDFTDASGSPYNIVWSVDDGAGGTASATTVLTVSNVNRAPTVSAPGTANGNEGTTITFPVTATDPDGDHVSLSAFGTAITAGATFTDGGGTASGGSGTFSWATTFSDAGSYSVTFAGDDGNGGTASAATVVGVSNIDRAPQVTAPPTASGDEGGTVTFGVTASDPDGEAIASLTADTSALPSGNDASFTANGTNTSGTFTWHPVSGDAGTYTVTFTATNAMTGTASTSIQVSGVNHAPVVSAPASELVDEGQQLTFGVSATDQDGDAVGLSATGAPPGASFNDNGDNTGTFDWTPSYSQSGSYTVTFVGNDGNGGTGSASTAIEVSNVNRAPTADAGGPYTGIVNVAVSFDGSGSSDPDGDALTYLWDFGDGGSSAETNPSHTYTSTAGSPYAVTLEVSDGSRSDTDGTTATILDVFPATAFVVGGNRTTRLWSGKPFTCVQIEPVQGSFDVGNVNLSSIRMVSDGTGSVGEIFATDGKTTVDGDKDRNGVTEIVACFAKDDLKLLFDQLASGRNTITVSVEGDLLTGGGFMADLELDVLVSGKTLAAGAAPNPFNPETSIYFALERPGTVRLQIFDLTGRLVNTLVHGAMPAGDHAVRWDGRTESGGKVASGIYYFRLEADGQRVVQRLTVLK